MMRPCFILCLMVLIVIPDNVYSFFNMPVREIINATGNLTCYLNGVESGNSDYQLCAIRVYINQIDTDVSTTTVVQSGMWFTNIYRHLIMTRNCVGFSNASDTGSGTCDPMPYERATRMTLCICATRNCNQDLLTCIASNDQNPNNVILPRSLPSLTGIIECNQTSDVAEACFEHNLISNENCSSYTKTHAVLCTIGVNGNAMIQEAFIEENYEAFFDNKLHQLKPIVNAYPSNPLLETQTCIYYMYYPNAITSAAECACTQGSFCNLNISTCAPNSVQIELTTLVPPITSGVTEVTTNGMTTIDYTTTAGATGYFNGTNNTFTNAPTTTTTTTSNPMEVTNGTMSSMGPSNTTHVHISNSTSEGSGVNNWIIVGVVVGVVVLLAICFSVICCYCMRSGSCHCPCRDRSSGYQV